MRVPLMARSQRRHATTPADPPAGVEMNSGSVRRSGSDPEHLVAALRTRAGNCRLAVLHGDALGIDDFDLLLVLDAIGLGHDVSSSSTQRGGTRRGAPHPLFTFQSTATVASGPSRHRASDAPSRRGSEVLPDRSRRRPPQRVPWLPPTRSRPWAGVSTPSTRPPNDNPPVGRGRTTPMPPS